MEKLYTVSKNKTGSCLWLRSWTPYCQIQTKLKKVGENTRPFRYDLNQILYSNRVEVTNTFKGLDLIECLKNYGQKFMILYMRQWSRPSPRKRNAKKAKWLSEEVLQMAEEREAKGKGERKDIPIWMQSSKEVFVSIIKYSNTRDILGMMLPHHSLMQNPSRFFSNLLAVWSPFFSALHCQCSLTWCWFSLLILSPELSIAPLMHSTLFSIRLSFPQDVPENTNFWRLIGIIFYLKKVSKVKYIWKMIW